MIHEAVRPVCWCVWSHLSPGPLSWRCRSVGGIVAHTATSLDSAHTLYCAWAASTAVSTDTTGSTT